MTFCPPSRKKCKCHPFSPPRSIERFREVEGADEKYFAALTRSLDSLVYVGQRLLRASSRQEAKLVLQGVVEMVRGEMVCDTPGQNCFPCFVQYTQQCNWPVGLAVLGALFRLSNRVQERFSPDPWGSPQGIVEKVGATVQEFRTVEGET